ncbi:MAG: hypothetical protein DHS20C14_02390 [Phycisphaeraceae bacterium]|nr:MAG: hypothetical protein DHS20C14_02390 [Phycisphaeraceae bacterium]
MRVTLHSPDAQGRNFAWLDEHRDSWMAPFADMMNEDDRVIGRVLDVGCADEPASSEGTVIRAALSRIGTWDGLDPSDDVFKHPLLTRRWKGGVEELVANGEIPESEYDAAISCFVFEHVADPRAHLAAIHKTLKPGGVVMGYTPNWWHPFAMVSRSIELIGLKDRFSNDGSDSDVAKVNAYPAYYRLGSAGRIAKAARGLGYSALDVWYMPCTQWQQYFPSAMRFAPRLYARLFGTKVRGLHQMIVFRLQKEGEWQSAGTGTTHADDAAVA